MPPEVPAEDRLFGQLLVRQGVVPEAHVHACLAELARRLERGEPAPKLAELLVERGHLSAIHLQRTQRLDGGGETPLVDSTIGAAPPVPPDIAEAAADPSKRIGKYVRLSSLGAGGMGEVWRGWDLELARPVALKFVKSDDADDLGRLVREAQTAARLTHPGIAQVYDVGHHHDRPFIAMQLIDGRTLGDVVSRKPREAARAVRDAALAVQFAHDRGVLHRDLKPSNLMIELSGRVYVLDFGLARTIGAKHSRSGFVVGTPVYMSPEQARAQALTERSDVYSLGATLYELVAGWSLFPGTDAYELLRRVVDEDPPPLPHDVDRDLRLIIGKCLRKEPSERYASARELADDLDRYLDGREVRAHPPSAAYRVKKFVSRRRAVVATITVAALVVTVLVVALGRASRTREDSLRELHGLWAKALLAKQGLYVAANDPARVRQDLRRAADDVGAYVERHPDQPQAHYVRARVLLDLGELAPAEMALRTSVRLAPDFKPGHALLGRVLLEQYAAILNGGRWETYPERAEAGRPLLAEARASASRGASGPGEDQALRWGLPRTPEDDVGDVMARALAAAYVDDDREAAQRMLRDAMARAPAAEYANWLAQWGRHPADRIRHNDDALARMPHFARARFDRGRALLDQGREEEAIADFTTAIKIDPRMPAAWVARGNVRKARGDFEGAIADFTEALSCDPGYVGALVNRANVHVARGRLAEALRDCDEALRIAPDFGLAWTLRARVRSGKGDLAGAIEDGRQAVRVAPRSPGSRSVLADILFTTGDFEGGLRESGEALRLDPGYIPAFAARANARLNRGDVVAAEKDLDAAVAVDPNHAYARGLRGVVRMRRGDHARAREDLEVAYARRERSLAFMSDLAWARLFTGDDAGARQVIDECVEAFPGAPEALMVRGVLRSQSGDHAAALTDLDEVIRQRPAWAAPYVNRGIVRAAMRDEAGALADFDRGLEIEPGQARALASRGKLRYFQRAWREAIADFTAAVKANPSDVESLAYRGLCHGYVGEFDRQIADLEAAIPRIPAGPDRQLLEKRLAEAKQRRDD